VRDIIYEHLLTEPTHATHGKETSQLSLSASSDLSSSETAGEPDPAFSDGIAPGSSKGYPFIARNIGLFCASKQLHSEASDFLYSENTFVIAPEYVNRVPTLNEHMINMLTRS